MLTLFLGFACIGGLLAGYLSARLGPNWAVWALWGAGAALGLLIVLWGLSLGGDNALGAAFVFYGLYVPFAGCAAVASLIGLAVRAVVLKGDP